jgi:hypothetical protein
LHRKIFHYHSPYGIGNIVFVVIAAVGMLVVAAVVVVGTADYPSIQDSHVVLLCLYPKVSFCLFFG